MRTLRALALIPVAGLFLAACAKGEATHPGGTFPTGNLNTNVTSTVPVTVAGSGTGDTTDAQAHAGPVQIDVLVGTDSRPSRVERVRVGSAITINITNPNAAEDYHIGTVDLEQKVAKATMATFNFTASSKGNYSVESKTTNDVLLVIEVS